ncbi:hypothetical protein CcI156_19955 [Frankia sp. CcI156]|uniref:hypothetical protein n=1 Tax=Frankia TaxID=1854 RepID=UPI0003CFF9E7|nr:MULTISPECIES: hypothetical protein [Frankia]ETA00417.1 hypothetical protein CcI6DRAFT_04172 [Frankia sp. CcI6]KFB03033.1 hypothetical protein ALLO2DRAFT_04208 [Frankia sp. Allo2]OAA20064.1 hypothetical protein AAY23_109816 [Frankia casuarinae]OHV51108.1 hypothetical protein CgIS1_19560 [Frankia sp. CgIS1]ONH22914.1 hypothetical protein CcI156_19955 [Frankia sp. CcI156]
MTTPADRVVAEAEQIARREAWAVWAEMRKARPLRGSFLGLAWRSLHTALTTPPAAATGKENP